MIARADFGAETESGTVHRANRSRVTDHPDTPEGVTPTGVVT